MGRPGALTKPNCVAFFNARKFSFVCIYYTLYYLFCKHISAQPACSNPDLSIQIRPNPR